MENSIFKDLFASLTDKQVEKLENYLLLLKEWNAKVNLVSRKEENLALRQIAPCVCITNFLKVCGRAKFLDVGTGGGLPGIILAICYPESEVVLVDSIAKKINAVSDMIEKLELKNAVAINDRAENIKGKFDFVTGRAVTNFWDFCSWTKSKIRKGNIHSLPNGFIYWKGGELEEQFAKNKITPNKIYDLNEALPEANLEGKYILSLSFKN